MKKTWKINKKIKFCGVYEIVNTVNGKKYIGSSFDISTRLYMHKYHLQKGTHSNSILQRAFNKYGEKNFLFKPLIRCDKDMVLFYEQMMINSMKPKYNISKSAIAFFTGMKHSKESKSKIASAKIGNSWNKGRTPWNKGKTTPIETRKKLSDSHKGLIRTEEHKKNLKIAMKKYFENKKKNKESNYAPHY